MELKSTINEALDLTRRLEAALEAHEQDLCDNLLAGRAQAMAAFDKAHQSASSRDRRRCMNEIRALVEANRHLQDRSGEMLALVREEFRGQLGQSAQGQHSPGGESTQACLDRKA